MEEIIYRSPVSENDFKMAAKVESVCLSTAWSEAQIADLPDYAVYICAVCDGTVCGIASMYAFAGEGQIMNVAVLPEYRCRGIATGLMQNLNDRAAEKGCEFITLEVAEDNIGALALYEKQGFSVVGRRKGFYNGKDALNMEKKL